MVDEVSQASEVTTVEGFSRLHFGLLDLSGATRRVDGGLGIAIKSPSYKVTIARSNLFGVSAPDGFRSIGERVFRVLCSVVDLRQPVHIQIDTAALRHAGFGSTTQCSLAVAAGLLHYSGVDDVTLLQLATWLGRGGTSGVGVHLAVTGGLVVDGGRSWPGEKSRFGPSSSFSFVGVPPLIARLPFPSWGIVVVVPREAKKIFGRVEVAEFLANTPIPLTEVERGCRLVLMGILPTVAASDFHGFTEAMTEFRQTGFKRIEWERLGATALDWDRRLGSYGIKGISVSSWGPALFGFVESYDEAIEVARLVAADVRGVRVIATMAENMGYLSCR